MKFVIVAVFIAVYLVIGSHSASISHTVSKDALNITGSVDVKLGIPIEEVWDSLSQVHRYPTIKSGDTIALRSAYTSGSASTYWLRCYTSRCYWSTCRGSIMTSSGWTSCSKQMMFTITAKGKTDGEPIVSGDTVSLKSTHYGGSYRLYCSSSSSTYCRVGSIISSMTGNAWLSYSYAAFEIYSKNANDGDPVQYGDVVGLKFPYSSNSAWLTYYGSYFYPRSCSSSSKTSCAKENTWTGFKTFKKLS